MSNENKQDPLKGSIPIGTYENAILNAKEIVIEYADKTEYRYILALHHFKIDPVSRCLILLSKDEVNTKVIICPFENIVSISLGKVGSSERKRTAT